MYNKYIIGKIPAYNHAILPDLSYQQDKYLNRLVNNMSIIELEPTSYKITASGIISNLVTDFETSIGNMGTQINNGLATITNSYSEVNADGSQKDLISNAVDVSSATLTAIKNISNSLLSELKFEQKSNKEQWMECLSFSNIALNSNIIPISQDVKNAAANGFIIQGTNDSTFNETISNEYGPNFFQEAVEKIGNKLRDNNLVNLTMLGLQAYKSFDSSVGREVMSKISEFGPLSVLTGMVQGVRISFPQSWKNSDYNSSMNIMLKLVSPSGDSESINRYIKEPLEVLLRAAAPVSYKGLMYGYPQIWQIKAHGIMKFKFASITAITITRGGNDTIFNKYEEPCNVDVRIMITPINPGFSQGPGEEYFPTTTPFDINESISSYKKEYGEQKINTYKTISI